MKPARPKCALPYCAKDAYSAYRGGHRPGRPPEGSPHLPRYCDAHRQQLQRMTELRPLRVRGKSGRAQAIEECAVIAEFHGAAGIAALFRQLAAGSGVLLEASGRPLAAPPAQNEACGNGEVAAESSDAPETKCGDSSENGTYMNGAGET